MNQEQDRFEAGMIVEAEVRSGRYIAEIMEINGPRALVKIVAVLKHPEQGDLHQPYNPDVAMFHERRALSFTEKTTVLLRALSPYRRAEIPPYKETLLSATAQGLEELYRLRRWIEKSIEILKELETDYKK
ncbi:sporulation phosphorelay system protein KapB [Paenibacillus sp. NEAU-GSW1]|uniref:sporulation phosphorelay system protein KapB n=1 Tax=Paenibacillus sp. NEAU-GSW1 TaxID=2682486 RepID=UPI0012E30287|nr:sporulation phosphorelay system protein KapB [Paenibacillus sp. NEAU-GSW1]MUT67745.1 kinase [Paenibacillus sp. NEAU-GSW1]